jgi:hypothetical protein
MICMRESRNIKTVKLLACLNMKRTPRSFNRLRANTANPTIAKRSSSPLSNGITPGKKWRRVRANPCAKGSLLALPAVSADLARS